LGLNIGCGRVGEKQYPTGVRPYGAGIQIRFSWDKKRYEPIWPRKPTQKNIAAAAVLRSEIVLRAKSGLLTLEYLAEHFPEYANSFGVSEANPKFMFGHIAQAFLDKADISRNTRLSYRQHLNSHVMPEFSMRDVRNITEVDINQWVMNTEFTSTSAKGITISALRGVFSHAVALGYIESNPAYSTAPVRGVRSTPDPLSPEERDRVLAYLERKYTSRQSRVKYLYAVVAFWTGMRPGEILALNKGDVSLESGKVSVTKTVVKGVLQHHTKTRKDRVVLINQFSRPALEELMAACEDREPGQRLLWAPRAPDGYKTTTKFHEALRYAFFSTGVRVRSTYVTRHTYASVCLTAGMNPAFVASQLGNSVKMVLGTYAKWIASDTDALELSKLGKL